MTEGGVLSQRATERVFWRHTPPQPEGAHAPCEKVSFEGLGLTRVIRPKAHLHAKEGAENFIPYRTRV